MSSAPLYDHPVYAKYFAMLKGGHSKKEIEMIMKGDGENANVILSGSCKQ